MWGSLFWRSGKELERFQRSAEMGLGAVCGEAERRGLLWPGEVEVRESIVGARESLTVAFSNDGTFFGSGQKHEKGKPSETADMEVQTGHEETEMSLEG